MAFGKRQGRPSLGDRVIKLLRLNSGESRIYAGFFLALIFLYMFFSDGNFSFLLTLSSLLSCLSFMVVTYCIESGKSCKGISLQTMFCYVVLLFSRLMAIVPYYGYLPADASGDFLYQSSEFVACCFAAYIVYLCAVKYKNTYEKELDTMSAAYILIPSFVMAMILHPSLNRSKFGDTAWAFALYVETFCVLPQLIMFQASDRANTSTVHFTAAQSSAKILGFIFWISTYKELNARGNILTHYVGHCVIFTQFLQILIVADFFFHYMQCITRGIPVELIMAEDV
ncbi:ER lumen protein retaining receptor family protein [Babesia bovis T2Bo]|uniref:Membrane protein, putative n=1 Tax=Babesia bovis TaxID=5865 RepID=A7AMX4_BABBO|nr:ER lumen protein retaining receptor family protein [Babesia bovis T2Bo]EDO07908.1 ER lumen protein retaining receptor family protein [Babesia bovis T2Bo]BAN64313.1 membrane protein, putative [Babesia bovis]|eukprot:XP_001611476.1 membrane protein [Babesia bovis T2Bo]